MSENISEKYKGGATINQYSSVFAEKGFKELAHKLYDDKQPGLDAIEIMELPTPVGTYMKPQEYLENPDYYFDKLGTNKYYINVIPSVKGLKKSTTYNTDRQESKDFITEHLPMDRIDNYTVGVHEYHENVYGGNIVISPEGRIYMEFGEGSNADHTKGSKTAGFHADKSEFDASLSFDFEDEELKDLVHRTLFDIPHEGEGAQIDFWPGYYEFGIYRHEKTNELKPVFLDYKDNDVYQLPKRYEEQKQVY